MAQRSAYQVPVAALLRDVPSTMKVDFRAPFDEVHEFEPRGGVETDVASDATVHVEAQLQSFSGGLRVRGTVTAPWFGVCRRCSEPVTGEVAVAVDERYVDERGPGDEDAYLIKDDLVDLTPLVHDAVLLELPLAPLCREDCAGLCAYCGGNRNESPCNCQAPADPRWAILDGLSFTDSSVDEMD